MTKRDQIYALAVLADCLNAFAVGAPLLPTFHIRSGFLPAAFCALIRVLSQPFFKVSAVCLKAFVDTPKNLTMGTSNRLARN